MLTITQEQIVRALLAEMRAKLAEGDEAGVLCLSGILATFSSEAALPELQFPVAVRSTV